MTRQTCFRYLRVAAALALACGATPTRATAETADDVFDAGVIHEIRLFVNARDLADLREHYTENTYYPADMQWGGTRVYNVGIRSRGVASRSATKLGLRVDFNRYVDGQRFAGVASIVLDNLWTDPAMFKEQLAMAFLARMGQPASRESVVRVYINGAYEGLYALVEAVDSHYLSRTLGDDAGTLFEYHWHQPYHFEDLGDDLDAYASMFEPRTHESAPSVTQYTPIRDMVRDINEASDAAWRSQVEDDVDLRQVVTYAAIEMFLAEDDGFAGYAGIANFYLYRLPGSHRHMLLPWDRDNSFRYISSSVFLRVDDNLLLRRALAFPDLRALYLDVLETSARSALDSGWLEYEVVRRSAQIADAAHDDPRKPYTDRAHDEAVAFLLEFSRQRPLEVMAQVKRARAELAEQP